MNSILHGHLAVKNVWSRWIPHNLTVAQKEARVDWGKEILKNTIAVFQKMFIRSSQVTNHGSMLMSPKQNKKKRKKQNMLLKRFKNHVLEVSQSEWKKCFDNWFERMQKCINLAGEYFEKQ